MIYILCAFEAEARAVIDAYKLEKKESSDFKLFFNEEMLVLISGMGQKKAKNALEYLLLNYPNTKEDIFINLGTCAGQKEFEIGTLVQIKQLQNEEESHRLCTKSSGLPAVTCFSSPTPVQRPTATDIAEMEAISIYPIVSQYFSLKQVSFLKIVSDHFNPVKLSKPFVIELTNRNLKAIKEHLKVMQESPDECY